MQPVVPAVARVTGEADMIQSGAQSGHSARKERVGQSIIETYILPYVKQIASGILLYYSGSSSPGLCDILEEWDGVGGSRGRGHMHAYG